VVVVCFLNETDTTAVDMLILIYGVTGTCGQALARAALEAGHQVRGSGRTPDKLDKDLTGRLESFVRTESIYDISALDRAVAGVEAVISAVAPVPEVILEGQLLLLRAAERAGVKVRFPRSWSQSPSDKRPDLPRRFVEL
jgi:uncharacterized protein YbjT (DUF2867 family)